MGKKIRDMAKVLEDFEELDRAYQKSRKVIEAEGFPRFVVRCLVDLEDFIGDIWEDKDARKKRRKIRNRTRMKAITMTTTTARNLRRWRRKSMFLRTKIPTRSGAANLNPNLPLHRLTTTKMIPPGGII